MANTVDRPATFGVQVTPGAEASFIGFVSEAPPVNVVTRTAVPAGGSAQVPVFVPGNQAQPVAAVWRV